MTITYSLDVANTRFCGFTKLLGRWKGSIYKILWKEFLAFVIGYTALSIIYRCLLDKSQKEDFENVVIYFETFVELIPLSFVLGFYVTLVIGRWWNQFDAIPWPDRLCYMIGAYVHGSDERSRLIRRSLGRYLILLQAITFQSVSTAVKKRFPTSEHLVSAGLMTKEERTIYEKLDAPYGKWWLPAQWFSALLMRAKKEGRIKDSILLDGLFREFVLYRSACGTMFNYDWISVPLVYTQVVTLATYTYSLALMMGRQYLDPEKGYDNHKVDLYVPFFTLLQFFFYVGWLKVAEQIVNPYGEDDDDFELNWCLDRNCQIVFILVDHFHAKHPKLKKDVFWDEMLPQLPQTKITASNVQNPQLGSAYNMAVDPADAEFIPMDTLLEEDNEANVYSGSINQGRSINHRPSFLMNILNSTFGSSSLRRRSTRKAGESFRDAQGHINPTFAANFERTQKRSSAKSRKSSVAKKPSPTHSRASSITTHPNSIRGRKQKLYDLQQVETTNIANGGIPERDIIIPATNSVTVTPVIANLKDSSESKDLAMEGDGLYMPPIPEESSKALTAVNSTLSAAGDITVQPLDDVHHLVAEASKILEELNKAVTSKGHKKECEWKGYESCCSLCSDDSSSDEEEDPDLQEDAQDEDSVIIDLKKELSDPDSSPPNYVL